MHSECIEYCIAHRNGSYCPPSHITHLLQPLDVGPFSLPQKVHGNDVGRLTRLGNVDIYKGNFLRHVVKARMKSTTRIIDFGFMAR